MGAVANPASEEMRRVTMAEQEARVYQLISSESWEILEEAVVVVRSVPQALAVPVVVVAAVAQALSTRGEVVEERPQ